MELEDRCVPTYVVPLPTQGNVQLASSQVPKELSSVMYAPTVTDVNGVYTASDGTTSKLITIMNNSTSVVYPILSDGNSTPDTTKGTIVHLVLDERGSGYSTPVTVGFGSNNSATATVNAVGQLAGLTLRTGGSNYGPPGTRVGSLHKRTGSGAKGHAIVSTSTAFTDQPGGPRPADPKDPYRQTYRGTLANTMRQPIVRPGLKPGHEVTVMLPLVFWTAADATSRPTAPCRSRTPPTPGTRCKRSAHGSTTRPRSLGRSEAWGSGRMLSLPR